jgi:preprotein translocase subunit SecY
VSFRRFLRLRCCCCRLTIVGFSGADGGDITAMIARFLQHGQPIYMLLYAALIIFFAFFYTAMVFNPEENAEMLRKYGGFIPGIRPGKHTADYLDYILTRITSIGALVSGVHLPLAGVFDFEIQSAVLFRRHFAC